ncbi:tRNA uridine-5-carboxymethylaminomethyl(34) synthesis GTPase MnmE [Mesoplasma syrphidae]|uniref:tRNA modification GTPase MnmE n=1 Tax=Mesoplasma syrphidae TaxID=225999 RepID=A0A2K9BU17_9MOLU|nr:tRNA uridine-5-carboxymethylaminomethyl(34) synthesis GTPase MnmE [Mesoplasma syrphidae]AUF83220.1 tRNA uridine-5-carboxymethylaminomethyl(34) synthesis GTPase MnmE [Mesoplasma syrphidae]
MAKLNDTIVAPATSIATQAIALIRISGDDAFVIINNLLKKKILTQKGVFVRKLYENNNLVDEVVLTTFVNPQSFTGENVVEIACHGGILNTNRIIRLILNLGARMAMKGEFSQRSFLNGKIDLIQAEGINDLIHATNDLALKVGIDNMSGINNKAIVELKANLIDIISRIQVSIDYPDYDDIEGSSVEDLIKLLTLIEQQVTKLLVRSKMANKSVEGIKTAIVGQTNVGKSSILNTLLNEDKAIVTDIPGTTRDIVEGQISLGNVTLNLVDTAGIRQTDDVVESLGIKKSKDLINKADLVIFVMTKNNLDSPENVEILKLLKNKSHILTVNKNELLTKEEIKLIVSKYPQAVFTSAINNEIDDLIFKIKEMYVNEEILASNELILININQIALIESVQEKIKQALQAIQNFMPIDIVNVDLYEAWNYLNELIGEQYDEEIIDNIFRKYCLGK